ncbi:hypothetical protein AS148_25215 [Achromobacter xylosoxidans]|nr:hypothetical protein AS148_25215 [Achromobacter xylosoxidans]
MDGLFVIRAASSELVAIPRYDYAEQLRSYVRGLFAENSAPKRLWDSDPLDKSFEFDAKLGAAKFRQTEAGQLIVEATEYYVLETLSTHLTDYFGQSGISSEHIQELSRDDIPDIVLKNRFLDTFSRPMRDRAAFVDENFDGSNVNGVVAAFGVNGTRYSSFDLALPVGATGKRLSPSSILIETPKFKLEISIEFRGFSANLPYKFAELYLAELSFSDIKSYEISLSASIEFSRLSLLSRSGWDYHAWLDSFLEKLEKGFSIEGFLAAINWETAATVARTVQHELHSKNFQVPPARSVVIDD